MNNTHIKSFIYFLPSKIWGDVKAALGINTSYAAPKNTPFPLSETPLFDSGELDISDAVQKANLGNILKSAIARHEHGDWSSNWDYEKEKNYDHLRKGKQTVFSIQKNPQGGDLWLSTNLENGITCVHFDSE